MWLKVGQRNQFIRCVAFYAALALNQGRMSDVLRILDGVKMNSVTEQIKIVALAELSYFNEVNESLASWAQGEDGNHSKRQISTDVVGSCIHVIFHALTYKEYKQSMIFNIVSID